MTGQHLFLNIIPSKAISRLEPEGNEMLVWWGHHERLHFWLRCEERWPVQAFLTEGDDRPVRCRRRRPFPTWPTSRSGGAGDLEHPASSLALHLWCSAAAAHLLDALLQRLPSCDTRSPTREKRESEENQPSVCCVRKEVNLCYGVCHHPVLPTFLPPSLLMRIAGPLDAIVVSTRPAWTSGFGVLIHGSFIINVLCNGLCTPTV